MSTSGNPDAVKHAKAVKILQKGIYEARKSAFNAGMFALFLPLMALILINRALDGQLETLLEESKLMYAVVGAVLMGCWKGMQHLAVTRHDPKRQDNL